MGKVADEAERRAMCIGKLLLVSAIAWLSYQTGRRCTVDADFRLEVIGTRCSSTSPIFNFTWIAGKRENCRHFKLASFRQCLSLDSRLFPEPTHLSKASKKRERRQK